MQNSTATKSPGSDSSTFMIKKLVINVKTKRSGQGRRKSKRKFKTKLKIELSHISTVMEVKGQLEMRIRKYVSLTVPGGREKYRDRTE